MAENSRGLNKWHHPRPRQLESKSESLVIHRFWEDPVSTSSQPKPSACSLMSKGPLRAVILWLKILKMSNTCILERDVPLGLVERPDLRMNSRLGHSGVKLQCRSKDKTMGIQFVCGLAVWGNSSQERRHVKWDEHLWGVFARVFGSQGPSLVPRETEAEGMARWLGGFLCGAVRLSPLTEWVSVSTVGCGGRRLVLRFSEPHLVFRSGCFALQDSRSWQNCPEGMSPGRVLGVWERKTASCWGCDSGMDGGREEVLLNENEKFCSDASWPSHPLQPTILASGPEQLAGELHPARTPLSSICQGCVSALWPWMFTATYNLVGMTKHRGMCLWFVLLLCHLGRALGPMSCTASLNGGRRETRSLPLPPLHCTYYLLLPPGFQMLPDHRLFSKTSGSSSLLFVAIVVIEWNPMCRMTLELVIPSPFF